MQSGEKLGDEDKILAEKANLDTHISDLNTQISALQNEDRQCAQAIAFLKSKKGIALEKFIYENTPQSKLLLILRDKFSQQQGDLSSKDSFILKLQNRQSEIKSQLVEMNQKLPPLLAQQAKTAAALRDISTNKSVQSHLRGAISVLEGEQTRTITMKQEFDALRARASQRKEGLPDKQPDPKVQEQAASLIKKLDTYLENKTKGFTAFKIKVRSFFSDKYKRMQEEKQRLVTFMKQQLQTTSTQKDLEKKLDTYSEATRGGDLQRIFEDAKSDLANKDEQKPSSPSGPKM